MDTPAFRIPSDSDNRDNHASKNDSFMTFISTAAAQEASPIVAFQVSRPWATSTIVAVVIYVDGALFIRMIIEF